MADTKEKIVKAIRQIVHDKNMDDHDLWMMGRKHDDGQWHKNGDWAATSIAEAVIKELHLTEGTKREIISDAILHFGDTWIGVSKDKALALADVILIALKGVANDE